MSKAVADALEELSYAFPRQDVPPQTIGVYDRALDQFPEPAVLAAINHAMMTCTFFPSISELTDIMAQHANGPDDLAETAWTEVQREARRVGYRQHRTFHNGVWYEPEKPKFSSSRIAEAVESVGWQLICQGDEADTRTAFIFSYRAMRKRDTNRIQRGDFGSINAAISGKSDIMDSNQQSGGAVLSAPSAMTPKE